MSMMSGARLRTTFRKKFAGRRIAEPRCWYCGVEFDNSVAKTQHTLDHVVPQSDGGESAVENLVDACMSCNSKKGFGDIETLRAALAIGTDKAGSPRTLRLAIEEVARRIPECEEEARSILVAMERRVRAYRFHGEARR